MIDRINIMLENIIERAEKALPDVTSINKMLDMANMLISIKSSFEEKTIIKNSIDNIITDEI